MIVFSPTTVIRNTLYWSRSSTQICQVLASVLNSNFIRSTAPLFRVTLSRPRHSALSAAEDCALDEGVVVKNGGRDGHQVGLFVLLLLRSGTPFLGQEVIVRHHDQFRASRAQFFPFVAFKISIIPNQHGRRLRGRIADILGFKIGLNRASAAGLVNGEGFGPNPIAVL